jgi:hypothetical protein
MKKAMTGVGPSTMNAERKFDCFKQIAGAISMNRKEEIQLERMLTDRGCPVVGTQVVETPAMLADPPTILRNKKKDGLPIPLAGEVLSEIIDKKRQEGFALSQGAIADGCGIGRTDLSRYLNGSSPMKMSEVKRLADFLDVKLGTVIEEAFRKVKEHALRDFPDRRDVIEAMASAVSSI